MQNTQLYYIDRKTKKKKIEEIYGKNGIYLFYGNPFFYKIILPFFVKFRFFSKLYGFFQKSSHSKKKIVPFIKQYKIDTTEFLHPTSSFRSFNDFFCRKLKKESRPIESAKNRLIAPTDGRYLVYNDLSKCQGFFVKGHLFSLQKFLGCPKLVEEYREGALALIRLCPTDYHRFHFPDHAAVGDSWLINGCLWSVNPLASLRSIHHLSENKRMITELFTENFGKILYIEIGATFVGTIHQTYEKKEQKKGNEKGFFSFGGSAIALFLQKNRILFDQDLVEASEQYLETLCLMGTGIGSIK